MFVALKSLLKKKKSKKVQKSSKGHVSNTNVFAALESLIKKKKSKRVHKSSKGHVSNKNQEQRENSKVFWAPASDWEALG